MDKKMLRGGVIGFGKMGLLHSANINTFNNSILCAICDSNKLIRNSFRQFAPHINVYKNHRDMLENEELDFVFITTPTFMHVTNALDCYKYGCNFFVEKPLSINEAEALPLLEANAKRPLITMVGYMMRYMDTFKHAKKILDSGVLGEIISFNATIYVSQLFKMGKGWRYNRKESGGGCINTQAAHALDMMCWFFDFPRAINARTISYYSKNVEDFGHVTFAWENGLTGWLDSSWSVDNHRMLETTFKIHSEKGTLIVNDDFVKIYMREKTNDLSSGLTVHSKPELFSGAALDIGVPYFTKQDEDFVNCVLLGKQPESDVINACKIQKIIDSIYMSAESDGQTILI